MPILAGLDLGWIVISQNRSHSLVSLGSATATSTALGLWIRPQEPRGLLGCLHLGLKLCFSDHLTWSLFWIFKGSCFLE